MIRYEVAVIWAAVWVVASGIAAWARWGRRGWRSYLNPQSVADCTWDGVVMTAIVLGLLPWWDMAGITWLLLDAPWLAPIGPYVPLVLTLVTVALYVIRGGELRRNLMAAPAPPAPEGAKRVGPTVYAAPQPGGDAEQEARWQEFVASGGGKVTG